MFDMKCLSRWEWGGTSEWYQDRSCASRNGLILLLAGRNILIHHLLFTSHLANSHPSPSPFDTAANKKPASGPCGFFICYKTAFSNVESMSIWRSPKPHFTDAFPHNTRGTLHLTDWYAPYSVWHWENPFQWNDGSLPRSDGIAAR